MTKVLKWAIYGYVASILLFDFADMSQRLNGTTSNNGFKFVF